MALIYFSSIRISSIIIVAIGKATIAQIIRPIKIKEANTFKMPQITLPSLLKKILVLNQNLF